MALPVLRQLALVCAAGSRVLYPVTLQRNDGKWGYASSQRVGSL